ncbi:MAG: TonB-dependent receptor [Bacteroidota bacterium]|nr:TonB-dependent receptor [Bacteroidota bacterium]
MRKLQRSIVVLMVLFSATLAYAQPTTVSGKITNSSTKETLSAVSVTIKGTSTGSYTDDKGNFKFTTSQKPPFTLVVTSVGFATKEVVFSGAAIDIDIAPSFTMGDEVVVAASRVPEKILESPVSIERVSAAAIRNAPSSNYYEMIGNLKGVDVVASSLTFKSVGTRGFNVNGNLRLNQIVDGMDNQAPGLNFSVGSIVGISELDVDNMELLPGASSALYGPGGMNGTLLINSKDPFKYQGLSFQIKQGINHVDNYQRNAAPYYDWSIRWAKKISERLAFKINAQFIQAQDWLANDKRDYSRTTGTPNGQLVQGNRSTDPNYDGVNVYGDETTASLGSVSSSVLGGIQALLGAPTYNAIMAASNAYLGANPSANIAAYNSFLTGIGGGALVAAGYSPIVYGSASSRNYFAGMNVSRTGYDEKDVINPTTLNFKTTAAIHYKLTNKIELIGAGYFGTGNTVYTGSDRYSLKNLRMAQAKLELRNKNWYVRAYTTQEDAGDSYNATISTRLFNEAWKPSSVWYPTYAAAYASALSMGMGSVAANAIARSTADQGRPTGSIYNNPLFQKIVGTPISKGGGLFVDKTALYQLEGQYNLTDALGLAKTKTDFLVGGNWKRYWLNSEGTLFADQSAIVPGKIMIEELGAYGQLSQRLFDDYLKLSVSGRYDKNSNFDGHFTPRASAVVKLAEDQNLRLSYQTAYRFPSTQNQWINLVVGGGTYLIGGLQRLIDYYQLNNNPVYDKNGKLLKFTALQPEKSNSFEFGYKGLIAKRLLVDAYMYFAKYDNFISSSNGLQVATGKIFSVSQNAVGIVKTRGWGASLEYQLPRNFSIIGNVYSDEMTDTPNDPTFVSYFNTPKYRVNFGFANSGFLYKKRIGFNVMYRYQDGFFYEGTFGSGPVTSFAVLDGMVSYKLPATKSMIKLGATNLLNKYYTNGFGNAQVGGLYYISYAFNVL